VDVAAPVDGAELSQYTPRGQGYEALTAQVKAEEPTCWLCGQQIDPWRRWPDPEAFQADHVIKASVAPWLARARSNLRASHGRCNRERERGRPVFDRGYTSLDEF
jgi:5-methylcytosine-specific restriction endonuclease McrA